MPFPDPNNPNLWFPPPPSSRPRAIAWAQHLMQLEDFLVLDTETTGLGSRDEVIQIAILNKRGETLLDTLVKPTIPIPPFVTTIHGITDAHVLDAPPFPDIYPQLQTIFDGRPVVIYNAPFDKRLIRQSANKHRLHAINLNSFTCALQAYSSYYGEKRGKALKRKSLKFACEQEGIANTRAHWAVNDCLVTLELVKKMAEAQK
ncbi:MAG: 3'-5' exonuclease [Anaerolineae bacterium]